MIGKAKKIEIKKKNFIVKKNAPLIF